MHIDPEQEEVIILVALSALGGLLGHISRAVEAHKKIKWMIALFNTVSSGFVGYITILVCHAQDMSYEWTGVTVGIMGWLGSSVSVKLIEKIIRKRLGISDIDPLHPEYEGQERRRDLDD